MRLPRAATGIAPRRNSQPCVWTMPGRARSAFARNAGKQETKRRRISQQDIKEAAGVATSGPSLGRKHPKRASAARGLPPTHEISQLTSSVNSSISCPRATNSGYRHFRLGGRVILLGGSDSGAAIMNLVDLDFIGKPRLRALCDPCAMIENPRVAGGASIARSAGACPPCSATSRVNRIRSPGSAPRIKPLLWAHRRGRACAKARRVLPRGRETPYRLRPGHG